MNYEAMMSATEFLRLSDILQKLGFDDSTILKMLKYIESGKESLLNEILEEEAEKDRAQKGLTKNEELGMRNEELFLLESGC